MAVTQGHLAQELGLTQAAVSQALRGSTRISEATRRRVLEASRRLGYRPNASARATRMGRFQAVAAVSRPDIPLPHFNIVKGLMRGLARHHIHVIQAEITAAGFDSPDAAPRIMRELCVDGMVVHYAHDVPIALRSLVEQAGVPVVWANTSAERDCVRPDDRQAGELVVRTLLAAGHRQIAFIGGGNPMQEDVHYAYRERWCGYRDTMLAAGLQPRRISVRGSVEDFGRWLRERPEVTAVVGLHDDAACNFRIAAAEAGIRVPQEISLIGFRDAPADPRAVPHTAAVNGLIQLGMAAAEMLLTRLETAEPQPVRLIPWTLQDGGSVMPPRHSVP